MANRVVCPRGDYSRAGYCKYWDAFVSLLIISKPVAFLQVKDPHTCEKFELITYNVEEACLGSGTS